MQKVLDTDQGSVVKLARPNENYSRLSLLSQTQYRQDAPITTI